MTCAHCGRQVPTGRFCTACGADQSSSEPGAARRRWHSFAAHPGQRVARPDVLSTILPRLSHDRVWEFRRAFVTGLVGLTLLYLAGLIAAAIPVAALLVPLLYLQYLVDAEVLPVAPLRVLLMVGAGGMLAGAAVALSANGLAGVLPLLPVSTTGLLLLLAVLLPLVQEAVKPLPALLLRRHAAYEHTIDALTLGIAAGLGFGLAQTLVNLLPLAGSLPFRIDPSAWIYPLVGAGILLPLLQATCAGAVTAALWGRPRVRRPGFVHAGIPVAVVAHIAYSLGTQLLFERGPGHVAVLLWQGAVVAAMVLYLRVLLHRALLEQAGDLGFEERRCGGCGATVIAGAFCPACGLALAASSGAAQRALPAGADPREAVSEGRLPARAVVAAVVVLMVAAAGATALNAGLRGLGDTAPALLNGIGTPAGGGSAGPPAPAGAPGAVPVDDGHVSTVLPAGWRVESRTDEQLVLEGPHAIVSLGQRDAREGATVDDLAADALAAAQRRHPDARLCQQPVPYLLDRGPPGEEYALCYTAVPQVGRATPADELVLQGLYSRPGAATQVLTESVIYPDADAAAALGESAPILRNLRWKLLPAGGRTAP